MAEPLEIGRSYTAKDFAAYRAFAQRVAPHVIARTYYDADEDEHARTPAAMERYLRRMHVDLVRLGIESGAPVLVAHLKTAMRRHGSALLTQSALQMIRQIAAIAEQAPAASHGIGMWFRPRVAAHLKGQHLKTLGELVAFCNRRGGSWWRAVPRIGRLRAEAIVRWLRRHEASLGCRVDADVDAAEPLVAAELTLIGPGSAVLVPLERMAVPHALSGVDGINRATAFCMIQARHDLQAIRTYLNQYRDQPKTLRAYTKELERYLLWALLVRGTAFSSLLLDDCEAYKDFLAGPAPAFVGPKSSRNGPRWYPFASTELSAESQRYAVRVIRAACSWLVDVRYLAANPWRAVKDPRTVTREVSLQIDRALPDALWRTVKRHVDLACDGLEDAAQWRATRVAMLLMGESGLRREEAASATRNHLRKSEFSTAEQPIWALTVIGKRNKERTVPVRMTTVEAIRAHWSDRGQVFDDGQSTAPLLCPIAVPPTQSAQKKHAAIGVNAFTPDSLGRLVKHGLAALAKTMAHLDASDRAALVRASAHAFRHTFGTVSLAAQRPLPLDVVQAVLGHASLQTTTIYVRSANKRVMETTAEMHRFDVEAEGQ